MLNKKMGKVSGHSVVRWKDRPARFHGDPVVPFDGVGRPYVRELCMDGSLTESQENAQLVSNHLL